MDTTKNIPTKNPLKSKITQGVVLILAIFLFSFFGTSFFITDDVIAQEYTPVTKIEGSGDKTTETFNIKSDKWRINWSIVPTNEYAVFGFYVYEEGDEFSVESVMAGEQNSDTTIIREGPGKFYIKVSAANLKSWILNIEEGPPPSPIIPKRDQEG